VTLSQAKAKAYADLEIAIQQIITVFRDEDPSISEQEKKSMLTAWLVVTSSVRIDTEPDPDDDEYDMTTIENIYSRRGQNPLMSLALAHEYVRHYGNANNE
jgi:hypothetical protein